jgi:uncharacterized protein YkwD
MCLVLLFYASKTEEIKTLVSKSKQKIQYQPISVEIGTKKTFFEDWTEQKLVDDINKVRIEKSLSRLTLNSKLNQAAFVRLALTELDDYEASKSGMTRDKTLKSVGYSAKFMGDLVLLDFFKNKSPSESWLEDEITKENLLHPDFKELGVAVVNTEDRASVYIFLASPLKATIEKPKPVQVSWGGPDLWEAVNKRRLERGVGTLSKKDELCTIASIRLNQLLELGKLDGHAGFDPVLNRADLKWISEKYNISEYLAQGYDSPTETVNGWENTLGHKSLLQGGEYVWGCVYSQNSFAVAITAF